MADLADSLTVTYTQAQEALGRVAGFAGLSGSADAQLLADYLAQTRPPQGIRVGDEAALDVALAGLDAMARDARDPTPYDDLVARIEAVRRGDEEG